MGILNTNELDTTKPEEVTAVNSIMSGISSQAPEVVKDTTNSKDNLTVVLDGPLSHIYTEALNLVYANEDYASITPAMIEGEKNKDEEDENEEMLYVYCCNGDEIEDSDELVGVTDKLRIALGSKKYSSVMLALENNNNLTTKYVLLKNYSTSLNIPTYISRRSALEHIRGYRKHV
jgi:hypothetical protein